MSEKADFPALKEKRAEVADASRRLRQFMEQAGGAKTMDLDRVDCVQGDAKAKIDWFNEQNTKLTDLRGEMKALEAMSSAIDSHIDAQEDSDDADPKGKSIGDLFVNSKAYSTWERDSGGSRQADHVTAPNMKVLFQTTDGWQPESVLSGQLVPFATAPAPRVSQIFPQGTTRQELYKWEEETVFSDAAGETAEGGEFHEQELQIERREAAVRKVTAWLSMTDEQLEDKAEARSYVNDRLGLKIRKHIDRQCLRGSGTGTPAQLQGVENLANIQSVATDGNLIDEMADLFDMIRDNAFAEPSVAIMKPSMWTQKVATLKNSNGDYMWHHPMGNGPKSLWGVPVITPSEATAGKVVTGDFQGYSRMLWRRGMTFKVTDSHVDDFTHGRQAVRVDVRLVLAYFRQNAFAQLTGIV